MSHIILFFGFAISLIVFSIGFPAQQNSTEENPEEAGDFFEGDMILTPNQIAGILFPNGRNGMIKENYRWPNSTVFYELDTVFDDAHAAHIRMALNLIEQRTCIRFYPRTEDTTDYIYVTGLPKGCNSAIGHNGGRQKLNLQMHDLNMGCFRLATICHEFIHALGFYHQQSASDRDSYVQIIKENIKDEKMFNFFKHNTSWITDFGITYDYGSVMHYGPMAFSKNGQQTIVPLDKSAAIGQRINMSPKDIMKLNIMYNCSSFLN